MRERRQGRGAEHEQFSDQADTIESGGDDHRAKNRDCGQDVGHQEGDGPWPCGHRHADGRRRRGRGRTRCGLSPRDHADQRHDQNGLKQREACES